MASGPSSREHRLYLAAQTSPEIFSRPNSYFSSLFAASKAFPAHPGFASGFSMCIFGLSPLFLSLIASTFFTNAHSGLDVTNFLTFLAVITGLVYVLGAFILRALPPNTSDPLPTLSEPIVPSTSNEDPEPSDSANERAPLLPHKTTDDPAEPHSKKLHAQGGSALALVKDPHFWLLAVFSLLILGAVSHSSLPFTVNESYHAI